MSNSPASERVLFDFAASGPKSAWILVNDDVMGGVSTSSFRQAGGTAVFSGEVSLENNGGFASVRSQPARHDLSGCDTFVISVRGDGRRFKFTVRMETGFDAPLYRCGFTTKAGEWQEHRFPIADFVPSLRGRIPTDAPPLDPSRVKSAGFLISDQQAGAFRLEVASVKAVPGRNPQTVSGGAAQEKTDAQHFQTQTVLHSAIFMPGFPIVAHEQIIQSHAKLFGLYRSVS